MLGPDTRVVQTRRDRVGFDGLTVLVLQQIGVRALESAGRSSGECGCVPAGFDPVASRLVTDQAYTRVVDERVEDTDRVGSATHTGDDRLGQPARLIQHLCAGLESDHPLEVTHHHRERVGTCRRTEAVIGLVGVGDPVPERLVDRVLEGLGSGFDRYHRRAQQSHPRHVERLARGVHCTHVDHTLETQQRTRRRRGHPVLACACLGDHPGLTHFAGQQGLTENVVDLVRSGVVEVFSLQKDPSPTGMLAESLGLVDRGRAPGVVLLQSIQFIEEGLVAAGLLIGRGDLLDDGHQRLGDIPAAVRAEMSPRVRVMGSGFGHGRTGAR